MAADGLRVAVARDDGLLRDLADIPERPLRAELSKGTITKEFAAVAKEIADELKTLAIHGDGYTAEQFKRDMTREALYTLTDKRLKQRQ